MAPDRDSARSLAGVVRYAVALALESRTRVPSNRSGVGYIHDNGCGVGIRHRGAIQPQARGIGATAKWEVA